jgi:OHCU decarboxylase
MIESHPDALPGASAGAALDGASGGAARGDAALTLGELNGLPLEEALAHCSGFFENSPWIVERALRERPFERLADFHAACMRTVAEAGTEAQIALIRAHPDLVGRLAREGRLGAESTSEQAAAGLTELTPEEADTFERYNAAYHQRFGFPFVICARKNRKDAILAAFPERLENDREREIETALEQIGEIAWLRMTDAIRGG